MFRLEATLLFASVASAAFTITDPSDRLSPADWSSDNALLPDFADTVFTQEIAITSPSYNYDSTSGSIANAELEVDANDTSVVVAANGADVTVTNVAITKTGYSTSFNQASFFGLNAAVNVANDSTASISNVNVTTHNGAANIYSYGTGTVVTVDNAWLYSSGANAHGLYAAGNGTINAKNVYHYSGGIYSSSFAGDNPAGYINVEDSVAHTDGIGSAVCYSLGTCNLTNVIGYAANAPALFMDGVQSAVLTNSDVTSGLLGGVLLYSYAERTSGATVAFEHSKLTTLGDTPGLWYGNIIASTSIVNTQINNTASGVLAVANFSQVTQSFDHYGDYSDNSEMQPAEVTLTVEHSELSGSLVAYNGSSISISFSEASYWSGDAYSGFGDAYFAVSLDNTSFWIVTSDTALQNFSNEDTTFSNVISNGFTVTYEANSTANSALGGRTYNLTGGGSLRPSSS